MSLDLDLMKRAYFIFIINILLVASCARKQEVAKADYEMDVVPSSDTLVFSDYFESFKIIPLRGRIVSHVTDAIFTEGGLIFKSEIGGSGTDRSVINLFSEDGEFLLPILRIGRGPEEMVTVDDMCYNRFSNTLDVLGNYGQAIYQFDLESYKITNKIDIDKDEIIVANRLYPIDRDRYMLYKQFPYASGDDFKLYVFNHSTGQVEQRFLKMEDEELAELLSFGQSNNIYEHGGRLYFYEAFGQTVYRYDGARMQPYVSFAKNKFSLPVTILERHYDGLYDLVKTLESSQYIWAHINVFQTGDTMFSTYTYNNRCYTCIMDLGTGKSRSYPVLYDDIVWGTVTDDVRGTWTLIKTEGQRAIYVMEPFVLKGMLDGRTSVPDPAIMDRRAQAEALPDDANPIIVIMKTR